MEDLEETESVEEIEKAEKPSPKRLKLKKSWRTKFVSPSGITLTEIYCRVCVSYKNPKDFHKSPDNFLDKSGMMSICKECCENIYQGFLRSERDLNSAMLKTCRKLNWAYHTPSIEGTILRIKGLEKKNTGNKHSFTALYWTIINATKHLKYAESSAPDDLTFREPAKEDFVPKEIVENEVDDEIIDFWGEGYDEKDYRFLQKKYLEFRRDYKIDVATETFLAQQICYKMLELEKARKMDAPTDTLLKSISTMLKDAAWTPAMANMANSGAANDTWGNKIAMIQKYEPAEWLENEPQREKYSDDRYGNIKYFRNYYIRSLKNYETGSRDFEIENEDIDDDIEEKISPENLILEDDDGSNTEEAQS